MTSVIQKKRMAGVMKLGFARSKHCLFGEDYMGQNLNDRESLTRRHVSWCGKMGIKGK
jgi:hypothetical protein